MTIKLKREQVRRLEAASVHSGEQGPVTSSHHQRSAGQQSRALRKQQETPPFLGNIQVFWSFCVYLSAVWENYSEFFGLNLDFLPNLMQKENSFDRNN